MNAPESVVASVALMGTEIVSRRGPVVQEREEDLKIPGCILGLVVPIPGGSALNGAQYLILMTVPRY